MITSVLSLVAAPETAAVPALGADEGFPPFAAAQAGVAPAVSPSAQPIPVESIPTESPEAQALGSLVAEIAPAMSVAPAAARFGAEPPTLPVADSPASMPNPPADSTASLADGTALLADGTALLADAQALAALAQWFALPVALPPAPAPVAPPVPSGAGEPQSPSIPAVPIAMPGLPASIHSSQDLRASPSEPRGGRSAVLNQSAPGPSASAPVPSLPDSGRLGQEPAAVVPGRKSDAPVQSVPTQDGPSLKLSQVVDAVLKAANAVPAGPKPAAAPDSGSLAVAIPTAPVDPGTVPLPEPVGSRTPATTAIVAPNRREILPSASIAGASATATRSSQSSDVLVPPAAAATIPTDPVASAGQAAVAAVAGGASEPGNSAGMQGRIDRLVAAVAAWPEPTPAVASQVELLPALSTRSASDSAEPVAAPAVRAAPALLAPQPIARFEPGNPVSRLSAQVDAVVAAVRAESPVGSAPVAAPALTPALASGPRAEPQPAPEVLAAPIANARTIAVAEPPMLASASLPAVGSSEVDPSATVAAAAPLERPVAAPPVLIPGTSRQLPPSWLDPAVAVGDANAFAAEPALALEADLPIAVPLADAAQPKARPGVGRSASAHAPLMPSESGSRLADAAGPLVATQVPARLEDPLPAHQVAPQDRITAEPGRPAQEIPTVRASDTMAVPLPTVAPAAHRVPSWRKVELESAAPAARSVVADAAFPSAGMGSGLPASGHAAAAESAARPGPDASPNPMDRAIASQVLRVVERQRHDDAPMIFRLTPPELGTVRIELRATADGFSASLHADDPAVHAALDRMLPSMRQELRSHDSPLRDLGLAVREPGSSQTSSDQRRDDALARDPGQQSAGQQGGWSERQQDRQAQERAARLGEAFRLDGIEPPRPQAPVLARSRPLAARIDARGVDALA